MFMEYPKVFGGKYKVCSPECIREIRWRESLSIMNEEYRQDPEPYVK